MIREFGNENRRSFEEARRITVPAEALTGRLSATAMLTLAVVTVVAVLGSRAFWQYGVRNYSGASA